MTLFFMRTKKNNSCGGAGVCRVGLLNLIKTWMWAYDKGGCVAWITFLWTWLNCNGPLSTHNCRYLAQQPFTSFSKYCTTLYFSWKLIKKLKIFSNGNMQYAPTSVSLKQKLLLFFITYLNIVYPVEVHNFSFVFTFFSFISFVSRTFNQNLCK